MASSINAVLCALAAIAFWTLPGFALGRLLLPRVLALSIAPVLGWCVYNAAALPILVVVGFAPLAVTIVAVSCVIISLGSFALPALPQGDEAAPLVPPAAYLGAAVLALAPAAAILPKISPDAVLLADPIFDHSKIAIIDAMARQGLPPIDPVFGGEAGDSRLVYYYLWHFSAAQMALLLRISGWEADIGLTWFTAFSSLCLMMGLAVWLAKRSSAALVVVLLAAAGSLRWTLGFLFGSYQLTPVLAPSTGFAGWLFQAAWVPQHMMSASCVVAAILFMARFAERQSMALLSVLVLAVVAGFESSTYVGGVTFAVATLIAGPLLLAAADPTRRLRIAIGLAAAALLVLCLVSPFLVDQFRVVAERGDARPILLSHFPVLGPAFPDAIRRVLDLPAYWLILLPIELPASYVAGAMAFAVLLRKRVSAPDRCVPALACLAGAGLSVSWLLVSTLGDNNDLALRAVLPATMALIVAAAAGFTLRPSRRVIAAAAAGGLVLSVPDSIAMVRWNVVGTANADAGAFAQTPEMWTQVRRYASPAARVANNPLYLQDLTPWPANMSWALLANRSSCFAGRELALALAPLSQSRRETINAQFTRAFAGHASAQDIDDLARKYSCDVVVLVPQDGAWRRDPFAASADYQLAEERAGRWRIYLRTTAAGCCR